MSKSIQIMAIAVAFVALTLISGVVYADEKNGKPFEAIWVAINDIQLTPGPQGATGATGADGTNGITNINMEKTIDELIPRGLSTVSVPCKSGDVVLGGGYEIPDGVIVTADKPDGETGWLVGFITSSNTREVNVTAICATP